MNFDSVLNAINTAKDSYYQLVLLVGQDRDEKEIVLMNFHDKFDLPILNVNKQLSKILLEQTTKQRSLHLSLSMDKMIDHQNELIILDNIEVLFDNDLGHDPLRLLQSISRNQTVVAFWSGQVLDNKLIYAEQWHAEYRSYDTKDLQVIEIKTNKVV